MPRNQANKNTLHTNNDFMLFSAIKSIENISKNAIQIPCQRTNAMIPMGGTACIRLYSLGRTLNFIMTSDPRDSHHAFRSVAEKATNSDVSYRYADAGQLSVFFEKSVEYEKKAENKERINAKISSGQYDEEIESYLFIK